jgi:DNA-binding CsgD family transcriptional regulator/tetratricopeptide (TPR) repeat protein
MRTERPASTAAATPTELPRLPADAVPLTEVGAVFGAEFSVDDAAAVLGEPVGRLLPVVHELLAADVLIPAGNVLMFRDDAVRQEVYARIPDPIRRALHRQIGTVLLDRGWSAVAGAGHLIAGRAPGDRPDTAALDRAVLELAGRSPRAAADLAVQALQLTDATDDARYPRAVTAVDALVAARRVGEAARLARCTLALPRLPAGPEAQLRLSQSTILLMSGQPEQATAEAGSVLAERSTTDQQRAAAELIRLFGWLVTDDLPAAQAAAEAILAGDECRGSEAVLAGGLTALAWVAWSEGRLDSALGLIRAAVARARRAEPRGQHPLLVLAGMLTAVGDFDEAGTAVEQAGKEIELADDTLWSALPPLFHARLHLAAGRLDDAVVQAERALAVADELGLRLVVPLALTTLAQIAVRRGDLAEAAERLERCRLEPGWPAIPLGAAEHTWAEAQLADAEDGPLGAMKVLADQYGSLSGSPALLLAEPAAAAWLTRVALATGEDARAQLVVSCAEQLAAGSPGCPSNVAAAAHARGLLDGDAGQLERAATGYRHPWAAASAAEDAGLAYGSGDAGAAQAAFERALAWYEQAGAARDAARVRSRLRELGVRPCNWTRVDRPVSGWASLTDAERRVAEVVSEGLTNVRVAERLFLSRYTVDFHLRQVFRKLGIRSRVELTRAALLRGGVA